MPKNIIIR